MARVTRANKELGMSLEKMRQDAEAAEARVQEYKNAHGMLSVDGQSMASPAENVPETLQDADELRRIHRWQ